MLKKVHVQKKKYKYTRVQPFSTLVILVASRSTEVTSYPGTLTRNLLLLFLIYLN